MKYWEIIADNLSKAGWSLGWVSTLDCEGRTIWIADAHRGDGQRYVVRAVEKLTAFVEKSPSQRCHAPAARPFGELSFCRKLFGRAVPVNSNGACGGRN